MNKKTPYDQGIVPDRPMARIVIIDAIEPIQGATSIEVVHVMGWKCIVKKEEFKVGDICIYVCIDSVLDPMDRNFSFLGGKPLKTKMILNTLSQGLVGPLSWITDIVPDFDLGTLKLGDNVTKLLKIKKYVPASELYEYDEKNQDIQTVAFPSFVPKTDEERVQNIKNELKSLVGKNIVVTRKEDGTSTTFILCSKPSSDEKVFMMCGRNRQIFDSSNNKEYVHYFYVEQKFEIGKKMKELNMNIAIQGETVGPKINGNKLKLSEYDFRVFNIYDIDAKCYLSWDEVIKITDKLSLNRVPLIYQGIINDNMTNIDYLMNLAESTEYNPGYPAEGIVVKTDREHERCSFKVISNKFLLANK